MTTRHAYRVYIRASAEQVWEAIVDPAFTRRYFHGTAFDEPPQAGQPYRTTMANGLHAVDGIIEVCEPPRRLVQTWHVDDEESYEHHLSQYTLKFATPLPKVDSVAKSRRRRR